MAEYTLEVTTGSMLHAGSFDNVFVTLIGTEKQSERIELISSGLNETGKVGTFPVTTLFSLGFLLFLKLEKDPFHELPEEDWFCSKILVRTPEEGEILFPCYKWLSRGEHVVLRGGRATKAFDDNDPRLEDQRRKELAQQKLTYQWAEYAEGMPYVLNIQNPKALPAEISLSYSKASQFRHTMEAGKAELKLKGLSNSTKHWESFEAMKGVSWFYKSTLTDVVSQKWKNDDFFGYQFLNGVNPFVIRRCSELPSNFSVTEEMVMPFLANGTSLTVEMKKGNIFIADYKILEDLPTKVIDGKPTAVTAALCLLYMNPQKKLLPIAIQLSQQPSEDNPVFLPTDSASDWLLAKLFVRHADVLYHQFVSHLLRTHLLAEVFAMATLRNLPMIHPLYKLLTPHHRYTIHINVIARAVLYGPGTALESFLLEANGQEQIMRRALSQTTYSSLCLPEDIAARGLESIPNFYYRDDSLRLWGAINSFVTEVVAYYYPSDSEVSADSELQEWINEIFQYGFLGNADSGFPSSFGTVEELIKFVTTVVFTTSARHAAVHSGQLDFEVWIPNAPMLLYHALPTTKGQSSMDDILLALPNESVGTLIMSILWYLTKEYDDFVPLGSYPQQRFDEPAVLEMIKVFQAELSTLSEAITQRNTGLELPFNYLNPKGIENSAAM